MRERTTSGSPLRVPYTVANVRARERRNSFPIHGYTGSNGGGKTMAAIYDSLPSLAAGRPVVSTCRILDPLTGEAHPLWVPLDDHRLLLELSYCDLILDEVTGVASSRDSAAMVSAVSNHLNQLRKDDVTLRWTTPNWKRADTIIREVTQGLTVCRGLMKSDVVVEGEDGLVRRWAPRRLFSWKTYDAQNFEEWSVAKEKSSQSNVRIRPLARQMFWGPGSIVQDCYDTYETVQKLGATSDGGLCLDCGGKRPPRKCACSPEETVEDPSPGMLAWRALDAARRAS